MAQGAAIGLGALFMECNEASSKQVMSIMREGDENTEE